MADWLSPKLIPKIYVEYNISILCTACHIANMIGNVRNVANDPNILTLFFLYKF